MVGQLIQHYRIVRQLGSGGMGTSVARLALGELLAKDGDLAGANEQFDALLKQWKDADSEFELRTRVKADRAKPAGSG